MSNTDTPRTNEADRTQARRTANVIGLVPADFARQLERELAAMTAERDRFRAGLEKSAVLMASSIREWTGLRETLTKAEAERDRLRAVLEQCVQCLVNELRVKPTADITTARHVVAAARAALEGKP